MARLTKREIVTRVCEKNGLRRNDASKFVEVTFEIIKAALERGEKVMLSNFGKFAPVTRHPHKWRDPRTGAEGIIRGRKVVTFKPSAAMKKTVKTGSWA